MNMVQIQRIIGNAIVQLILALPHTTARAYVIFKQHENQHRCNFEMATAYSYLRLHLREVAIV